MVEAKETHLFKNKKQLKGNTDTHTRERKEDKFKTRWLEIFGFMPGFSMIFCLCLSLSFYWKIVNDLTPL